MTPRTYFDNSIAPDPGLLSSINLESDSQDPELREKPSHAERSFAQDVLKRAVDLIASSIAVTLFSPLLVLVALLIAIDSKGPILFRQRRMGRHGKFFWILKFRTMVVDAEEQQKHLESLNESEGRGLFKIMNDPRITPIGSFLRRTSLDELPQLFNVLRGEMSLVGPRPLTSRDCEQLIRLDEPLFLRRLVVLPGITGPWQVSGRSRLGGMQMLVLDNQYVDERHFFKDIYILIRTVKVVLFDRDGAY